jgi:hypothetical protein
LSSLEALRVNLSYKLGNLRSLHRIVESDEFAEFYEYASSEIKEKVLLLIEKQDKDSLVDLIRTRTSLGEKSVRELRTMCRSLSIRNYHMLNKAQLLSVLESLRG